MKPKNRGMDIAIEWWGSEDYPHPEEFAALAEIIDKALDAKQGTISLPMTVWRPLYRALQAVALERADFREIVADIDRALSPKDNSQ